MFSNLRLKYTNLVADKDFADILSGSVYGLGSRIIATGMTLATSLVIARCYGADMVGVLAIIQSIMLLATMISVMGTNVSILRLIPEHISKHSVFSAFLVYRKAQNFVVLVSIVVGGLLFLAASPIASQVFSKPQLAFFIGSCGLFLVFRALMDLNIQAIRGLQLIRTFALLQLMPNTTFLFFLCGMLTFSGEPGDPVFSQIAAWVATALIGTLIMGRSFQRRIRPNDRVMPLTIAELLTISAPMMMTASMNFIIGQSGVLVLSIYSPESYVGYYAAAVKLATLTTFVLQAVNTISAPKYSELFHSGKISQLLELAQKSTKLIFWTTTPILLILICLGKPILALFGDDFVKAYYPMLILIIGQFINSISGSTGYLMNMTGHHVVFRNMMAAGAVLNLVLAFWLTPFLGLFGVALAGTLSTALWNLSSLGYIKLKYGRTIGYLPFLKL